MHPVEKVPVPRVSGRVGSCGCAGEARSRPGEVDSQFASSLDAPAVTGRPSCTHGVALPATPPPWALSGCFVGAVPRQRQDRSWGPPMKAGQPPQRWDALGCDLLAESQPLQLQEVLCVPSWEHSVSDERGLWIWRTSSHMVTPSAQLPWVLLLGTLALPSPGGSSCCRNRARAHGQA